MRIVFPALAICAALLTQPLEAQSKLPGIGFDLMPVGCRIHGVYGDGKQVIDEYMGRKGKSHVIRTYEGPAGRKLVRTTTYNGQGYMVRKDWAGGAWETFAPYSCFDKPGTCTYTYRNGDGADQIYRGKVTRRGEKMVSRGGFEGEPPFAESVITPGPFNMGAAFREGSTTFRVTRYENCGAGLPTS